MSSGFEDYPVTHLSEFSHVDPDHSALLDAVVVIAGTQIDEPAIRILQ